MKALKIIKYEGYKKRGIQEELSFNKPYFEKYSYTGTGFITIQLTKWEENIK